MYLPLVMVLMKYLMFCFFFLSDQGIDELPGASTSDRDIDELPVVSTFDHGIDVLPDVSTSDHVIDEIPDVLFCFFFYL